MMAAALPASHPTRVLKRMKAIRLVVNGDDFGVSHEVNEAVVRAYRDGCLTSCSLMAGGEAFEDAVRLSRENPGLDVGLHLVAVCGRSVLPPSEIPCLVDARGRFPFNPASAGLKYFFSRTARRQLKKELSAQLERVLSAGLRVSHIDSHCHMHVHPVIFDAAVELGERCGCRKMRVPEDDLEAALPFLEGNRTGVAAMAAVFRLLANRMRKKLVGRGFAFADAVHGYFLSGRMNEAYVLGLLDRLHREKNELYLHPAVYGEGRLLGPGEVRCAAEFGILVSPRVRARIEELDIQLTNYDGLVDTL